MSKYKIYNVLLVEDDDNSAKLVTHALDRYNFRIVHAPDGMSALTKVRMENFDLVISDIMMPYLDGLSFLEKAQDFIKNTPVIILTAVGDRKIVLRAAQRHVSHYILKPIEIDNLIDKVVNALKITTSDLIDKRNFPFKKEFKVQNEDKLLVFLDGAPRKNAMDEIYHDFMKYINENKGILLIEFHIEPIFFVEANSFRILDDLVLKIIKSTSFRSSNIKFFAPEIREAKLDPDKFPNLLACTIENRFESV